MFVAYIATSPEQEEAARKGLLHEFARFSEGDVTADELTRAQEYAIGTHAIRQQSGGAVLGDIAEAWMLGRGLGELTEFDARVRGVTAPAIRAMARKYFDEQRLVQAVVRGSAGAAGAR